MAWCRGARCLIILLFAIGAAGCGGVTSNPSVFPYWCPFGDVVPTHDKPKFGYYANFDPYAEQLIVRPQVEIVNPVGTQHVMVATIRDGKDTPRRNRRVVWMLDGVGHIIEADESGCHPARGWTEGGRKTAVTHTNYFEHRMTRGNKDPNDDFVLRPGQTWCVITSPQEGDTYMTVYAPGIYDWSKRVVTVVCRWVDATWMLPVPGQARTGSEYTFITKVYRHSDKKPLANYRVRYTIQDGPPAHFMPRRTQEAVVVSDLNGEARVGIVQQGPAQGINRVLVEVIRPPDPTAPSGAGVTVAKGETSVEWLAPQIEMEHTGPAVASIGQDVPLTIDIRNTGKIESRSATIYAALPEGVQLVSSQPPAVQDGRNLVWPLQALPPGSARRFQVTYRPLRVGRIVSAARVETEEGLKLDRSHAFDVSQPQLRVTMSGPQTAGLQQQISYQLTVTNSGSGLANNVTLNARFDPGLEHSSRANPLNLALGAPLAPGEARSVTLPLTAIQLGQWTTRIAVSADGSLNDETSATLTVQRPALKVSLSGPQRKYTQRLAEWNITVINTGDVALANVVVRDRLPVELTFNNATDNGVFANGEVVWNVGALPPRGQRVLQLTTKCGATPAAVNRSVVATADPGLRDEAVARLDILPLPPGLALEALDVGDPVEVGKTMKYQITVSNTGEAAANQVALKATVPPELRILKVNGASQGTTTGQVITFAPVQVPGRQTLSYEIEVEALRIGDVRFRVEMTSQETPVPILEEESTTITDPNLPLATPPPPIVPVPGAGGAMPPPPPPLMGGGGVPPVAPPVLQPPS